MILAVVESHTLLTLQNVNRFFSPADAVGTFFVKGGHTQLAIGCTSGLLSSIVCKGSEIRGYLQINLRNSYFTTSFCRNVLPSFKSRNIRNHLSKNLL